MNVQVFLAYELFHYFWLQMFEYTSHLWNSVTYKSDNDLDIVRAILLAKFLQQIKTCITYSSPYLTQALSKLFDDGLDMFFGKPTACT